MGNILKAIAVIEFFAAIFWAAKIAEFGQKTDHCKAISDILVRMQCEDLVKNTSAGSDITAIYIIAGGIVAALVFFALGHMLILVEQIHKRTFEGTK
ncbi:hypothetical protein [Thalassospira sp. TSL5-1]|uniref:hypothetical protein n=1 Tax=Thalassospira sp. TSL5-1 TaxID=1544451 RepID=UPI00093C4076|nr:hypothetical protein [Thalassospira sp. TSL5-1]OKH89912.1 hypothetical protein LF95_08465 [Thalassospira sp. TSL5-1]